MAAILALALLISGWVIPGRDSLAMETEKEINIKERGDSDSESVSGECVSVEEQKDEEQDPDESVKDEDNNVDNIDEVPEIVDGTEREKNQLDYPEYPMEAQRGSGSLPSSYGIDKYYQSSVKDQGSNGLCWSYGTYAVLEANMRKNGFGSRDFSEVHMAYSTSNHNGNTLQGWNRAPADGGNRYKSSDYLMRGTTLSGTVNESDDPCVDPYTVLTDRSLSVTKSKTQSFKAKNVLFLTDVNKAVQTAEVNAIKSAIRDYGGVGASMYCDDDNWNTYYNSNTGAYYYNGNRTYTWNGNYYPDNNHLVEIAGWNDSYSRNNFNSGCRPNSNGAWLIKNSWGTDFGCNGYMWISYEDTNFPISTFTIDGVEPYNSAETVYESDYKYDGDGWGYSATRNSYFMKVFTSEKSNQQLKAVKVFIPNADSYVSVDCIPDLDAFDPYEVTTDGNMRMRKNYSFMSKKDISITYPGWYTIELDDVVDLKRIGTRFAVIIKSSLTDASRRNDIGYDSHNPISSETYTSKDASYWHTTKSSISSQYLNFCIKAVTESGSAGPIIGNDSTDITPYSIKLYEMNGYEYRSSTGSWQSSPLFTGLKPDTEYTFYQRKIGTSKRSMGLTVRTKQVNLSGAVVTLSSNQSSYVYTGSQICPVVNKVTLDGIEIPSGQYKVTYSSNTSVGTGKITITGVTGSPCVGSCSKTFSIVAYDLCNLVSGVNYSSIPDLYYTGYTPSPSFTLTYNGKSLENNTDYSLENISPSTGVGTGTLKIIGIGNFKGTKTITYRVKQRLLTDGMYTIQCSKGTVNGWYTDDVMIRPQSGYSMYNKNNEYVSNITISTSGSNTAEFYLKKSNEIYLVSGSENSLGNNKTLTFRIDKTAPLVNAVKVSERTKTGFDFVISAVEGSSESGMNTYKMMYSEYDNITLNGLKTAGQSDNEGKFTISGLERGKTYYYGVVAIDNAGNYSELKKGIITTVAPTPSPTPIPTSTSKPTMAPVIPVVPTQKPVSTPTRKSISDPIGGTGGGSGSGGGSSSGGSDSGRGSDSEGEVIVPEGTAIPQPTETPMTSEPVIQTAIPTESPAEMSSTPEVPIDPSSMKVSAETYTDVKTDKNGNVIYTLTTTDLVWGDGATEKVLEYRYPNEDLFRVKLTKSIEGKVTVITEDKKEDTVQLLSYLEIKKNELELKSVISDPERKDLDIPKTISIGKDEYKVTSIKKNAFKGAENLMTVKIGDNVRIIGTNAFSGIKSLKSVLIGKKLVKIEKSAFDGISEKAVFRIHASKKRYSRIVKLIKKSGVGNKVRYRRV